MPLPIPDLDDRDFQQLLSEAKERLAGACPGWTDHSPSDPGMMLLELFAHLTETMIYRLNRLPEKAYIEFLRLLGVTLRPPSAAGVTLRFSSARAARTAVRIPAGTRVAVARTGAGGEPIVFATARLATLEAGETEVETPAHHCDRLGEDLGRSSGRPGQTFQLGRPPVVAPTGDALDLVVAVEAAEGELDERSPALRHEGVSYRVWREVKSFANLGADRHVYTADRASGSITFAPAVRSTLGDDAAGDADGETLEDLPRALAEVPASGRWIRAWYRRGGGPEGNVTAGMLTVLKDPLAGLEVTNPSPATGGREGESLENALRRGPQELHSLERAVTARDFEHLALAGSGAVARARALTQARLWTHASPGTVEVLLVPAVPEEQRSTGALSAETLQTQESDAVRRRIFEALDERRPLGTTCRVSWARYKTVRVRARVVVHRQENPEAVERRLIERLYRTLGPLPAEDGYEGWPFGQALRASHVYDILLAEPGVSYVDRVRLVVDEVPDGSIRSLAADRFQPSTWYAGSGERLFRSLDDADGWEMSGHFAGEEIRRVEVNTTRPGLLAVATRVSGQEASTVHLSADCGETWQARRLGFVANDLAWAQRDGLPILLLATGKGLYELSTRAGATPVQVLVVASQPELGFFSVTAATDVFGALNVAVAAEGTDGVHLSTDGGKGETFRPIGLQGEDVRVLAIQSDGPRLFLWSGVAAAGDAGKGCFSWELRGSADPPEGWRGRHEGWQGGSCHALAFDGSRVLAGSHSAGLLRLDAAKGDAAWQGSTIDSGLPLRDAGRFQPLRAVATDPAGQRVLAGADEGGVVRSHDGGGCFETVSSHEFLDKVTLPETWLPCSGEHAIEVVSEDEATGD